MKRRRFITQSLCITAATCASIYLWKVRWHYIVIHHSAGNFGTIDFLQKVHRQRQTSDPIDAIPYHYVIGNGNGLAMGEIASDWRKEYDIWGAHVSARNPNKNFFGIGICLVGNFEEDNVPEKQYEALVHLTKILMQRYNISSQRVSGHGLTRGESTKCPGKHFPMDKFRKDISPRLI